MQLRVGPHQALRESATTASLSLQLPVVVVQQLLQILLERRRRFNIEQITQTVSGTLSKCSNTRNNFFSATTTSRSFTTVGWLSSFRTAISLKMQIYAGLLFHTMMCIVKYHLMAVDGTPSLSVSKWIRFNATFCLVTLSIA